MFRNNFHKCTYKDGEGPLINVELCCCRLSEGRKNAEPVLAFSV